MHYAALIASHGSIISVAEFEEDMRQRYRHPPAAGADHRRGHGGRPGSARRLSQGQHQDQVRLRGDLRGRPAQDRSTPRTASWRPSSRRTPRAMPRRCRKSARSPTLPLLPTNCPAACRSPASRRFSSTSTHHQSSTRRRSRRARGTSSSRWLRTPTPRPMPRPRPRPKGCSSRFRAARTLPTWPRRTPTTPAARTTAANWALPSAARMVPEFDNAIFTQKIGDTQIVKSQFGYHIVQVEERQPAHAQHAQRGAAHHPGHADPPEGGAGRGELCAGR